MRPVSITIGLTPADADGLCAAQTTGAAAELSLNGALATTVGVARLGTAATILITCAADESARVFTVTGKNANGVTKVERLTGVDTSTVASTVEYREVSRVEIDGATSGNVSVGITGDTDAIATTGTVASAAAFTLDGVWTYEATMFGIAEVGTAATVKIYSAGDDTGDTFTIYGQDADGVDVSEAVTGASGDTATSTKLFKKVYAIYTDGASAGAVYAGWAEGVNRIAESQTMSGAGYLVMNGEWCGVQARHVSITSAGSDESGDTFTVVGLNRVGDRITEDITGPTASTTVKGDKNFSVVQAIYVDGALTGNVTVGSADECESQPVIPDYYIAGMGVAMIHSTASSVDHNFYSTLDNLLSGAKSEDSARWLEEDGVQSTDEALSSTATVKGVRVALTNHVRGTVDLLMSFPSGSNN